MCLFIFDSLVYDIWHCIFDNLVCVIVFFIVVCVYFIFDSLVYDIWHCIFDSLVCHCIFYSLVCVFLFLIV